MLRAAIAATTTIPMMTAILPFAVGPSALEAKPKLWQNAAPTIRPSTVTALSVFPSPVLEAGEINHFKTG